MTVLEITVVITIIGGEHTTSHIGAPYGAIPIVSRNTRCRVTNVTCLCLLYVTRRRIRARYEDSRETNACSLRAMTASSQVVTAFVIALLHVETWFFTPSAMRVVNMLSLLIITRD